MAHRFLKPMRVCIALLFFLPIAFLFLDFRDTGVHAKAEELLFLQFIPSMLNFLIHTAIETSSGFILVLLLTLLFGRVYCSTICPLGIFQDLTRRLGRKISKIRKNHRKIDPRKKRDSQFVYSRSHIILWYTLFFVTALLFLTGRGLMLTLLDPFSSFGRIFSNLFRPLVLGINNLAVPVAEGLGIHFLYRVQLPVFAPIAIGISLITLILVGWLSVRYGRLYCNTLCPVGLLLGFISKASLFNISIDNSACRGCRRCETECKTGCIDLKKNIVDTSRCVVCFNCISICPDQAMGFGKRGLGAVPHRQKIQAHQDIQESGRRRFMLGLAAVMGGVGLPGSRTDAEQGDLQVPTNPPIQNRPTTIPEKKMSPLSPPGSVSVARFTATCTACHLCVTACPSRVLVPSFLSYGLSGMMQPQMNFQSGHCNYDCTVCTTVCPTGAILPLSKEKKQHTQVGVAKFIKENCVVYTDNTNCGACSEHCPTKAVNMVPYLNAVGRKLVIPEMNEAICVGCGGCEHACPTKPYKAIYVDGNPVHRQVKKPMETKLNMETGEDFPF